MTYEKPLKQKIIDEIEKTGFPTEIRCASILEQKGWGILHNPSYIDDIENISREFDIRAYKKWSYSVASDQYGIGVYLIIECKKSEKPWVFFTTPEKYQFTRLGDIIKWNYQNKKIFSDSYSSDSFISDASLKEYHHYFQKPYLARTYFEPFKNQSKNEASQMIFTAIMSSIKATLFHLQDRVANNWLHLYYPLIIFNGELFEAKIDPEKNIQVLEAPHIQLSFSYMIPQRERTYSIWEGQRKFIIDIIKENYIEDYLRIIENEHLILRDSLQFRFSKKE
jgi:hypothetical protein